MTSATSLRSSADLSDCLGKHIRASFYRDMAHNAERMGELGNRLYAFWAAEIAERVSGEWSEFQKGVAA